MLKLPERVRAKLSEYAGDGGDWYGNWPLPSPRLLGERGTLHGDAFVFGGQSGFSFDVDPHRVRRDQLVYLDADGSSVEFGTEASVPGWEFLGSAKAGIQAKFARDDSFYMTLTTSYLERVADVDNVKAQLVDAHASGKYPVGTAVVVERLVADKALVIASRATGSTLNATISGDIATAPANLASLAGEVHVVGTHSGADLEQFGTDAVVLAFRAVVLTQRGWWWWRHVHVVGLAPQGDGGLLAIADAGADSSDYLVEF